MREIKFRAWDNKEKKWLLGYEYPNLGGFSMFGETMLFEEWSRILNRYILQQRDRTPEDLILMQYTGLKDKNGKEIYEGDIVRAILFYPESIFGGDKVTLVEETNKVIFDKGCWCIYGEADYDGGVLCRYDELYVLGNEFENPELLPIEPEDEVSDTTKPNSEQEDDKQISR